MKIKIFISFILILAGVAGRLFLVEFIAIPNLEIITVISLVSGLILGGFFTFLVPLSIIVISDFYFGNNSIILFTWSAFIFIGFLGWLLRKRKDFSLSFIGQMTGMGIVSSLFFFLYTNFGWWLLTNMYPHNWEGLVHCYLMGLPFLKTNLLGNLFFVPFFSSLALAVWKYFPVLKLKFNLRFLCVLLLFILI